MFSKTASKQYQLVKCYGTSSLFLKEVVIQISESLHLVTVLCICFSLSNQRFSHLKTQLREISLIGHKF